MKNSLATFREAGSFIAGLLIGISIAVPVSAMLAVEPGDWRTMGVFCAPLILALGLALHIVATTKTRRRRTAAPELVGLPSGFMDWTHQG